MRNEKRMIYRNKTSIRYANLLIADLKDLSIEFKRLENVSLYT